MLRVSTLNLLFPQWQGSGAIDLYNGAIQIYRSLPDNNSFVEVPVASSYSLSITQDVLGLSQISTQLSSACDIIEQRSPDRIFTIGGDCGVEIAPISFLNRKHDDMAVVWLDAHGDLNTPSSSPSKHFHGMPLRSLLGEGHSDITEQIFSKLSPEQIFLVGARDFDRAEKDFVRQNRIQTFSASLVNKAQENQILLAIKKSGFDKIYIHLDLDVVDPEDFSLVTCPAPAGIRINNLKKLLHSLEDNFERVGASILEFKPTANASNGISVVSELINIIR